MIGASCACEGLTSAFRTRTLSLVTPPRWVSLLSPGTQGSPWRQFRALWGLGLPFPSQISCFVYLRVLACDGSQFPSGLEGHASEEVAAPRPPGRADLSPPCLSTQVQAGSLEASLRGPSGRPLGRMSGLGATGLRGPAASLGGLLPLFRTSRTRPSLAALLWAHALHIPVFALCPGSTPSPHHRLPALPPTPTSRDRPRARPQGSVTLRGRCPWPWLAGSA